MREIQLANLMFHPEFRKLIGPQKSEILRPKVSKLLNLLITHFPKVVSKQECLEKLWPDTHVEQRALAQVVAELRKAFDQVGGSRGWVENIPKGGYCLAIDPVEMSVRRPLPSPNSKSFVSEPPKQKNKARGRLAWMALVVISLAILGWRYGTQLQSVAPTNQVRLGILPIASAGEEQTAWLKYSYPDLLSEALSSSGQVEVASFEEVYRHFQNLDSATFELEHWQATPLKQSLGVNALAQIEIQPRDGQLHFQVTLARENTQTVFNFISSDPSSTIATVAQRILQTLNLGQPQSAHFESGFLNEAYARGLDFFLKGEHKQAQPYFRICFDQNPDFGRHAYYLANTYLFLRQYPELDTLLARADYPKTANWVFLKARTFYAKRDFSASEEMLASLVAADATPRSILAEAHHTLGMIFVRTERFFMGQEHFEKSAALFKEMENLSGLVAALISQYKTKQYFGLKVENEKWEELIDLAKLVQNRSIESRALIGMGDNFYNKEAWQEAFESYAASLVLRRELDDELGIGVSLSSMGTTALMMRDFDKAETLLLQALAVNIKLEDPYNQANQYLNLGNLYLGQSRWDEAADQFKTMVDHCQANEDLGGVMIGLTGQIEVALFRGDYPLAIDLLNRAEASETMTAKTRAQLKCYRAALAYKNGQVDQALALMAEVDIINEGRPLSPIVQEYVKVYQAATKEGHLPPLPFESDPLRGPIL